MATRMQGTFIHTVKLMCFEWTKLICNVNADIQKFYWNMDQGTNVLVKIHMLQDYI